MVIGNPPYVDSETMVKNGDKEYRQEICQIYGSIKGNWDLFIPFIHQGMLLNNANGILAFIIPNKLISQDYAKTTRELILSNSIVEIRDYSRIKIFVNADVYPITLVIKKNNSGQNIAKMTKMKNINEVSCGNFINAEKLTSENWDMYFLDKNSISIVEKINSNKCTLEKLAAFQSPCTVSEAYLFKEVITDDNIEKSKKFINSGAIDKYTSLWGIKDIQYIKGKYEYPVILDDDIGYISKKRLLQSNSQKIIIANMTKEIEAFFDYQRKYIAGKSTTICIGNENDLKTVLSLLNSKLVSYWYKITFHSGKMSGGALSISQNKLKIIPLPKISTNSRQSFIELIDKIIFNKECNENTTDLEGEIDQLVYQLYDLTDEEIAIVEKSI